MPKDEFDFDDPMELSGVGLMTTEDTTEPMAECFIEEFIRLGHNHKQILALFRNPYYLGMNMVLQNRGEDFVRDKITEIFLRWRKKVSWPTLDDGTQIPAPVVQEAKQQFVEHESALCDPTGGAIPKINS